MAATACHHCGEALPDEPRGRAVDDAGHAYCCDGCASAARWIRDADLGDYYRLRTAVAGRVGTETVDLSAWDREDLLREHAHERLLRKLLRPLRIPDPAVEIANDVAKDRPVHGFPVSAQRPVPARPPAHPDPRTNGFPPPAALPHQARPPRPS